LVRSGSPCRIHCLATAAISEEALHREADGILIASAAHLIDALRRVGVDDGLALASPSASRAGSGYAACVLAEYECHRTSRADPPIEKLNIRDAVVPA
jgi:hypothetical protein